MKQQKNLTFESIPAEIKGVSEHTAALLKVHLVCWIISDHQGWGLEVKVSIVLAYKEKRRMCQRGSTLLHKEQTHVLMQIKK